MSQKTAQLVVIGAGPGGYAAAFLAADLGMAVTIIDTEPNPGGVCLYRGCIPSKALLHVAKLLSEAKEAKNWGIEFADPKINLNQLRSWKDSVVEKMTAGVGQLAKLRKINYIRGRATFLNSSTLTIQKETGPQEELKFQYCVLATGSRPISLPDLPVSEKILNSTGALELKDIPKTFLVVGGGYIGLELGTVYNQLGSAVTVVEMTSNLLSGVDRDLVQVLSKNIDKKFSAVFLNTKVIRMKETGSGIQVTLESNGKQTEKEFEKVLVAVGRKPNTTGLGLENTKVELDNKGFVKINLQRQTQEPHIYAIGDVAGEPMLAHKASHEGRVAVEAISGQKVAFEPKAIPAVVFTDPEIAWCGLTEIQAEKENREIGRASCRERV